ncbi:MAG TPA: diguanylate cyclase [Thermomicrobiales bacterium]|nr:diguanylate cyclase [Thermomicrobiales bacterium]
MNVLVVETDPALRRSLEFALAMRGHLAVNVDDAEAALQAATADRYLLVIIGRIGDSPAAVQQLCRKLRQLPGYERSSMLVAGSRDEPDAIIDALDAGANGYLSSPVDAAQLRARLEEAERWAGLVATEVAPAAPAQPTEIAGAQMLQLAADLALVLDSTGRVSRVVYARPGALGPRAVPLDGASIYAICHPEDAARVLDFISQVLDRPPGSPPNQAELRFLHQDGTWRAMDVSAANLTDQPAIGGLALVARDITHRRVAEQEIRRQALYDPLTSLPNRALFFTYLEHALARADRRSEPVVVMFMDIDDFALINSAHGRDTGDRILTGIGDRLRTTLRATDTAARMGDDEFTILLEDVCHVDEARVVADRISDALRVPFEIGGQLILAPASIGVAFSHPASRMPNIPSDMRLGELLRQADAALYRAKSSGKDRWVLYDATSTSRPPSSLPSSADLTRTR